VVATTELESIVPEAGTPKVEGREPGDETRTRMRRFYRDAADYEAQVAAHDSAYFRKYVGTMLRFLPGRISCVLELGAGSGEALHSYVAERAPARVVGLELSGRNLQAIRDRGAPHEAVAGDALQLPFAAGTFDVVTCFQVIEHLPSVQMAIDESLRVLKRPGYLVAGIPNHASLLTPTQDLVGGRTRFAFGVANRAGALRWLLQNARISLAKRFSSGPRYLYREPRLDGDVRGGDSDAVYYACPLDLYRDLAARGATLLGTDAALRWGAVGRFVPSEMRGSVVAVWRVD
jgi:SAM-dependent methyltransferase